MKQRTFSNGAVIYFIEYNRDIIKIGCTTDLAARLFELTFDMRLASKYPIRVLGYIEINKSEMYDKERALHVEFLSFRIKSRKTDFFRSDNSILDYIKDHCNLDCGRFDQIIMDRRRAGHPKLDQLRKAMVERSYQEEEFYL